MVIHDIIVFRKLTNKNLTCYSLWLWLLGTTTHNVHNSCCLHFEVSGHCSRQPSTVSTRFLRVGLRKTQSVICNCPSLHRLDLGSRVRSNIPPVDLSWRYSWCRFSLSCDWVWSLINHTVRLLDNKVSREDLLGPSPPTVSYSRRLIPSF